MLGDVTVGITEIERFAKDFELIPSLISKDQLLLLVFDLVNVSSERMISTISNRQHGELRGFLLQSSLTFPKVI